MQSNKIILFIKNRLLSLYKKITNCRHHTWPSTNRSAYAWAFHKSRDFFQILIVQDKGIIRMKEIQVPDFRIVRDELLIIEQGFHRPSRNTRLTTLININEASTSGNVLQIFIIRNELILRMRDDETACIPFIFQKDFIFSK